MAALRALFSRLLETRLLQINADDPEVRLRGRVLQALIISLLLIAVFETISGVITAIEENRPVTETLILLAQGLFFLLASVLSWWFLRQGRLLIAGHCLLVALDVTFVSLLSLTNADRVFPYLLLISVLVAAALDSVRASAIYLLAAFAAVTAYTLWDTPSPEFSLRSFVLTSLSVAIAVWFFTYSLQRALARSKALAAELEITAEGFRRQAEHLELVVAVGQSASASLDLEQLLRDTVYLIRDQSGFDHVTILLADETGQYLRLQAVTGEVGERLKSEGFRLPIGPGSIAGWVAANQKARIALDVGQDPLFFNDPNLPETWSEVALPLQSHGRFLGVLDVQSREANAFHDEDVAIFQIMADRIAAAIYNARLYAESERRSRLLTELQTITNLMSQQATMRNALNVLSQRAMSLLETDGGGVWLWQSDDNVLELVISFNVGQDQTGRRLGRGEGLSGRAFVENKTHVVDDYATWEGRDLGFAQVGFHAALAVPLRHQNEPIGILALTRSRPNRPFRPEEVQVAELLASQVGATIVNNQLVEQTQRLARRDKTISQIVAEVRRSLDTRTILETAGRELGQALGDKPVRVHLYPQHQQPGEPEARP
ncbi:MAG: GAF domain-containing protein [Chloroflexi bacterium]|nr:GAF domain-containing protein [Chloroflexota bacterium]